MVLKFIISTGLVLSSCASTTIVELNSSPEPINKCESPLLYGWNNASEMNTADTAAFNRAKTVCDLQYSGCLHKFIKKGTNRYWAVCGQPIPEQVHIEEDSTR